MKRLKIWIPRLVTRHRKPSNANLDSTVNQRQLCISEALDAFDSHSYVPTTTTGYLTDEDEGNELCRCPSEITAQEFNDLYPGDVELVYDQTPSAEATEPQEASNRSQSSNNIATTGTSFLDLPRELRDQIYECVFASSNKVWKLRASLGKDRNGRTHIREQLPRLFYALPLFSQEVLESHYKYSALRFAEVEDDSHVLLLEWIQRRGSLVTKHIRYLKIGHRMNINGPYICQGYGDYITTTIEKTLDGALRVHTSHHRSPRECQCGTVELVQERLSREDALADPDCMQRIEQSTEYGPVLGFALQLLEAVRLARDHQKTVLGLPYSRQTDAHRQNAKHCIMCGKRKPRLQY